MTDTPRKRSSDEKRQMRSAARLYAVQALFQMEASGQALDRVAREFETHRFGAVYEDDEMAEGDPRLFRSILEEAVNLQARIDQMTDRALVAKWPIDRIDPVLRALFRAAGAELSLTDTPPKVVITEYVDVALAFFPDDVLPLAVLRSILAGAAATCAAAGVAIVGAPSATARAQTRYQTGLRGRGIAMFGKE